MAESSYLSAQGSSSPEAKGRAQSFNEKLGELKKFASTSFTRAKQVTGNRRDVHACTCIA